MLKYKSVSLLAFVILFSEISTKFARKWENNFIARISSTGLISQYIKLHMQLKLINLNYLQGLS